MIKAVIRLRNNDVMVFDAIGEEIPEYQGRYQDVREGILRDAAPDTRFLHWFGCSDEPEIVSRVGW